MTVRITGEAKFGSRVRVGHDCTVEGKCEVGGYECKFGDNFKCRWIHVITDYPGVKFGTGHGRL